MADRMDAIAERWEERPGVLDEVVARGQEWKRDYPTVPFPSNLGLAVAAASDLSAAYNDLATLLSVVREVAEIHRPGDLECAHEPWHYPDRCPDAVSYCDACGDPAPCTTYRAITAALATEETKP